MSGSNTTLTRVITLNYVFIFQIIIGVDMSVFVSCVFVIVVMVFVLTLLGKLKWDQDTVFIESHQ